MTNQLTEVRLLAVPLTKDYKHTIYFADKTAQYNYFYGNNKHFITESSYQRKEGYLRFPMHIDELSGCNYLMYANKITGRWNYAFITDMVYKSDEVTWIYFEIDVLQTYMFDYTIKPSFVEREHCADDTFGKHTVPENLECGELVCEYQDTVTELRDTALIMAVTQDVDDQQASSVVGGQRYNGIFSGVKYCAFTTDQINILNGIIKRYKNADAITSIFMYPSAFVTVADGDATYGIVGSTEPKTMIKQYSKSFTNKETGYTPKNNKLNCYPYRSLVVSNNNGGSAVYHFEDFTYGEDTPDLIRFWIEACITPGGSIRLIPMDYRGLLQNQDEGLNLGKYPICNFASDEYTNWLTQNSVNIALNIASGAGQMIGGALISGGTAGLGTAVGGGAFISGAATIANQLVQINQMSFTPPQARGNINCGDVIAASNYNTFLIKTMTIKEEYMRIIDNFFDMFGYKTNRVKVPESNHRENYWYTKTIDVNIVQKDGRSVSQNDLDKIKACYNQGVTFWRSGAAVGNYELSNKPLTEV